METPVPLLDELWTHEVCRHLSVTDRRVLHMTSRHLARLVPSLRPLDPARNSWSPFWRFLQAEDDRHDEAMVATARFYTTRPVLNDAWVNARLSPRSPVGLYYQVIPLAARIIRNQGRDPLPRLKVLDIASAFAPSDTKSHWRRPWALLKTALYANRLDLISYFYSQDPRYREEAEETLWRAVVHHTVPGNMVKGLVTVASRGYVRPARILLYFALDLIVAELPIYYIMVMAQAAIAHQQYAFLDQLADWFGPLFTQRSDRQRQRLAFLRRDMKAPDPRVEAWFARVFNFRAVAVAGWTHEEHAKQVEEALCRFHALPF